MSWTWSAQQFFAGLGTDRKGLIRPFLQLTKLSNTRYQEILGLAMPGQAGMSGVERWNCCSEDN